MRNQDQVAVRRAILPLPVGKSATLAFPEAAPAQVAACALAFARSRQLPVKIDIGPDVVTVTRVEDWPSRSLAFPELDRLAVGESYLFELPPADHQRVRLAATGRNRTGAARFRCNREGDAIRVTREPLSPAELAQHGPTQAPARPSRYNLDRLATQREIRFELPPADHHKLRLACSHKARITGWAIRCRLQDDGSMLVYRTDTQDPTQQPVENAAI